MENPSIIKEGDPGYNVKFLSALASELVDIHEHCESRIEMYAKFKSEEIEKLEAELAKEDADKYRLKSYRENIERYQLSADAVESFRKAVDCFAGEILK